MALTACLNKKQVEDASSKVVDSTSMQNTKEEKTPKPTKVNNFENTVKAMTEIFYELKDYKELLPKDNFMGRRIQYLNSLNQATNKPQIDTLDITKIKTVRNAKVKSTQDMGNQLYPRAYIESWECLDEMAAMELKKAVDVIRNEYSWDEISKSPITYFRKDNELIFITPGGFYMLDKVAEIEEFLVKNL